MKVIKTIIILFLLWTCCSDLSHRTPFDFTTELHKKMMPITYNQ